MSIELAMVVITGVVSLWGILQSVIAWRLSQKTQQQAKKLEHQVQRLNVAMDQSIQRLHRVREAVIQRHKAYIYLIENIRVDRPKDEQYFSKQADLSASMAELRGLAFAIGDKELLELVNQGPKEAILDEEISLRGWAQHVHTRISQLLVEATNETNLQ